MAPIKRTKRIGILTAGGDSPGLNAAIRAVGKTAVGKYGWELIGFRDGFLGMIEDRWVNLDKSGLVGMLTLGGTVLGTSRDKPHRMPLENGGTRDMTGEIVKTYRRHKLDALVCLGGGGTHKNAARLIEKGASPPVRDRAWFYLAKIRYQRGVLPEAEDALAHVENHLPPALEEERDGLMPPWKYEASYD